MSTHDKARIGFARWDAVVVLLALTVLVGCQGLSAGKSSTPAPQQNNSPGSLGVNPLSLDFGSVPSASSKTLTLVATNNGTTDIAVSSVTFSAPQFSLSKPAIPITIAAGQSSTLSLVFAPTGVGSVAGSMTLTSDASNGSMTVSLTGLAMDSGQLSESPASL